MATFYADYHLHTYISHDGHETMAAMAAAARRAGMAEICVTDHCDVAGWQDYRPTDADSHVPFDVIADRETLMREDPPGIEVRRGIELGEAHLWPEKALEFAAAPGLDFVIGSLHMLREDGDFYAIQYRSEAHCETLIDRYMEQCLEIAELNFFDVFGHIGYFRRYMSKYGFNTRLDLSRWGDKIGTLLRTIIRNGKGIELNTSGVRDGLGFFPDEPILRLYKSLGGEIITVGSDAHFSENAGQDVAAGYALLQTIGFKYVTVFRERKPEFIRI